MANLLEGKVIAMTGAGRGIGRECAILAASEGARVVVNDPGVNADGSGHDDGPAAEVVEAIKKAGGEAVANFADVSTMEGGESVIQSALDTWGQLDGLINLAAVLRDRMVFNMTEEDWDEVIRIDLKGHFTTIKPASILFRQQRSGRIVNFSSVSGLSGNAGQANYGAAKAGIGGLTRVVARDLGKYGVTVNAIAPGANTRLTGTIPVRGELTEEQKKAREEQQKMNGAEMVAPMTVYLLTDDAWNINGKIFSVAAGQIGLLREQYPPERSIYKHGKWSLDELRQVVPQQLTQGISNPMPPQEPRG